MEDKVFLDTNYFIDAVHRKPEKKILDSLAGYSVFISPISIPVYCYLFKIKVPNKILSSQVKKFRIANTDSDLLIKSLEGPTSDLEDNIQLHSAAETECDYFLTNDEKLLNMKFFGKTKITDSLQR